MPRRKKEEVEEVEETAPEEVEETAPEEVEETAPEEVEETVTEEAEEVTEKAPEPELVTCSVVGQKVSGIVTDNGGRKTLRTSDGVTYDV